MGFALGQLLQLYCTKTGIDWASEGHHFFQSLNQEAMGNAAVSSTRQPTRLAEKS